MNELPAYLCKLHHVANDAATKFGSSPDAVFDPCGLILDLPPVQGPYWCTPTNVVTFASTGGDGVHYSYLKHFDSSDGKLPIIMTLPCADENNIVIAESFEEFFNLGYFVGWFSLEQLVYQEERAISYFANPDEEQRDYAEDRLEFLRKALQLRPIPPDMKRLRLLNEEYYKLLLILDLPD